MHNQAFSKILILIIILVIITAGIFVWQRSNKSTTEQSAKTIAIFVDKNTYNFLETEILQYVSDIENDLNANVKLFAENFATPQQVREKLIGLRGQALEGSILIGNIPVPLFQSDKPFIGDGGNILPSDRYYMDLESTDFIDEDNDGKFEYDKYKGIYSDGMPDNLYWAGRIKPYNNSLTLLKGYFNRNHLYRTGQIQPQKALFTYSMDTQSGPSGATYEIYENNMKDSYFYTGLYSRDQVFLAVDTSKSQFLNELGKDYESASINAHGNWYDQQIGTGITVEDIKNIRPKPYFYYLLSCSNGDFSRDDYLAAHYLLDGNGLVVIAYTIPALLGADEGKHYMEFLAQGETFGEAFVKVQDRVNELNATIIGDPTLSLTSNLTQ